MASIVIVSDGQYRWGADRTELFAAMTKHGWQPMGAGEYVEPEPEPASDDFEAQDRDAYNELRQDVQPVPGYAPGEFDVEAARSLPHFRYRPDLGQRTWRLTAA